MTLPEDEAGAGAARDRTQDIAVTLGFSALLLAALLCPWLPFHARAVIGNITLIFGPLLMAGRILRGLPRLSAGPSGAGTVSHLFLCAGIVSFVTGNAIWAYNENILHRTALFPSWGDAFFLLAYPCLLLGVLTLPVRPTPLAGRFRVFADSLMVMVALVTFSWYFVLGPTLMQSGETLLAKALGTAYPLSDIVLISCVMLLFLRSGSAALRPAMLLLAGGFCAIVATDTVFDYQTLHGTYVSGHPSDIGWTLGYMLVGAAARAVRLLPADTSAAAMVPPSAAKLRGLSGLGPALPPYLVMPAVGVLVWHTAHTHGDGKLEAGVYLGASLLVCLLLLRQFFTLLENQRLALELRGFNENLERLVTHRTETLEALQQLTAAVSRTLDADAVVAAGLRHTETVLRADGAMLWLAGEGEAAPPEAGGWLRAPLFWQGTPLGTIGVVRRAGEFDAADAALLESVAVQIAAGLGNARQYRAAQEAADRDPVTGLWNHRAIHQHLDDALEAARESGLTVLLADLDNFQIFNNTYGHPAGDDILRRVAQALTEECAAECGAGSRVARYGGDEFLLVLPAGLGVPEAVALAARLRDRLAREDFRRAPEDRPVPLCLSFGVAAFPQDSRNRHELLDTAHANLEAAKNSEERIVGLSESQRDNRALRAGGAFRTLDALVAAVDNKDRYTRRHSEDVAAYSLWIGEELGMDAEALRLLRIGGLLHDVGKIGVPDTILRKPGRLTPEEYDAMKQHPQLGAYIVGGVPGMSEILDCVRHHHERWDGGGYPGALAGTAIPLQARVMAVADAFSAMTTDRPYRRGMSWEIALAEVRGGIGTQFDPAAAEAFLCAAEKRRHAPLVLPVNVLMRAA